MAAHRVNHVSYVALVVLSLTAFLLVLTGYLPGQAEQADEGAKAHIFQLSIVALVPTFLVFFATADWTRPARTLRRLAFPATAVVLAFTALYYLEH